MPQKTAITGDTYAGTMVTLRENIKHKRRGNLSAGVLLLHDNAPSHNSRTSRAAVRIRMWVCRALTIRPIVQTCISVTTFPSETLKNFLRG